RCAGAIIAPRQPAAGHTSWCIRGATTGTRRREVRISWTPTARMPCPTCPTPARAPDSPAPASPTSPSASTRPNSRRCPATATGGRSDNPIIEECPGENTAFENPAVHHPSTEHPPAESPPGVRSPESAPAEPHEHGPRHRDQPHIERAPKRPPQPSRPPVAPLCLGHIRRFQIGRASCRERAWLAGGAGAVKRRGEDGGPTAR